MKNFKGIICVVMSMIMVLGFKTNVYAAEKQTETIMGSGNAILNQYSNMLAETYMLEDMDIEQQNELRRDLLKECKEDLQYSGYEAYLVDADSYKRVGNMLNTDLAEMGLEEEYTYLISFDSGEKVNGKARMSTGNTFTYKYNNVTYNMRYCTVTAADDPNFSKASTCNLLSSSSEKLIQNCLDTAINAYISAVYAPLGTISSICGLSISDFAPAAKATLNLNCGTNWTRVYTQVYSTYDRAWLNGSCVEYAKLYSFLSGTYYDASTNRMEKVPEDESRTTQYSPEYFDYTWRREKAVISLLNGNGCKYDVTGSVSYYYGDKKKITHTENF